MANAFKHVHDATGRITVTLRRGEDHAVIEVADNGPGIPVELREAVFQRYVQGAGPQRGASTGLGLAIAWEFIAQHGGSIVADAAADGGALFRIELPVNAPAGMPVAQGERLPAIVLAPSEGPLAVEMPADQGRVPEGELPLVLAVEDNPDLRAFIARSLERVARVTTAEDGEAGLAALGHLTPDLIVTDIMMPRLSGDEMVAEIRARPDLADVPIMVLSARADERLRISLLRGKVQDYLVKPFAAEELQARVNNLLQIKRARDLLRAEIAGRQDNIEELAREVAATNRKLRNVADEMRVARDAAEQASRTKSAFLNMVSHELRTPLTQLELQLALLRRRFLGSLSPGQDEILSGLMTATRRLAQLVVTVLDYSRIESERLTVQPQHFDLAALISDLCAEARERATQQGLDLSCHSDGALSSWSGDPTLTRIAIHNLLDNAIKYTSCGGISVEASARDGHAAIAVTDTGVGIAPEHQRIIFEPFQHVEEVNRKHVAGVGLGLTIVREIVAALGGRVELASQPGRGSTFSIELPKVEGP